MYCLVREVFSGVEGVTMTHHTWFLDEGRNAGVGEDEEGVGVMRANCWNPYYCFAIVVFPIFFFPRVLKNSQAPMKL